MSVLSLPMLEAVTKRLFDGATVESFLNYASDELVVSAKYSVDLRHLNNAARRGDGPLVNALLEHFGNKHRRSILAEGIRAERARPFSLKAARRAGKHKRVA